MRRIVGALLMAALLVSSSTMPASAHSGIITLTNAFRLEHGRPILKTNDNLERLAHIRARQISRNWGHDFWWMSQTNCDYGGENIAFRAPALSPERRARWFVNAWINSDSHRRVMLGRWTRMAAGIYLANGGMYGIEIFCLVE